MWLQTISFKLPALIPLFVGFPSLHSAGLGFHQILEHGHGKSLPFRHKHQSDTDAWLVFGIPKVFSRVQVWAFVHKWSSFMGTPQTVAIKLEVVKTLRLFIGEVNIFAHILTRSHVNVWAIWWVYVVNVLVKEIWAELLLSISPAPTGWLHELYGTTYNPKRCLQNL